MKRKEVEDVIGGKDAWENVDKADGEFAGLSFFPRSRAGRRVHESILGGMRSGESVGVEGEEGREGAELSSHLSLFPGSQFLPTTPYPPQRLYLS